MNDAVTRYYRSAEGTYIGAFGPGVEPPEGGIEVETWPDDARQVWDGEGWGPVPPPEYLPVALLRERLEAIGRYEAVVAVLLSMLMSGDVPLGAKVFKLLTLTEGVHRDDADLAGVFAAAQLTPQEIETVLA